MCPTPRGSRLVRHVEVMRMKGLVLAACVLAVLSGCSSNSDADKGSPCAPGLFVQGEDGQKVNVESCAGVLGNSPEPMPSISVPVGKSLDLVGKAWATLDPSSSAEQVLQVSAERSVKALSVGGAVLSVHTANCSGRATQAADLCPVLRVDVVP